MLTLTSLLPVSLGHDPKPYNKQLSELRYSGVRTDSAPSLLEVIRSVQFIQFIQSIQFKQFKRITRFTHGDTGGQPQFTQLIQFTQLREGLKKNKREQGSR